MGTYTQTRLTASWSKQCHGWWCGLRFWCPESFLGNHPHLQTSATSFSSFGGRGVLANTHFFWLWSPGHCCCHLHCHKFRNNYVLYQLTKTLHRGLYWMSGGFGFPSIYLGQRPPEHYYCCMGHTENRRILQINCLLCLLCTWTVSSYSSYIYLFWDIMQQLTNNCDAKAVTNSETHSLLD